MMGKRLTYYIESQIVEIPESSPVKVACSLADRYSLIMGEWNFLARDNNKECSIVAAGIEQNCLAIEVKKLDGDRYDIRTNLNAINSYHLSQLAKSKELVRTKN